MSFSYDVKEEMAKHISSARHCQIAELAAIIAFCGSLRKEKDNRDALVVTMERESLFRKCFTLLRKTYNIDEVSVDEAEKNTRFEIAIDDYDTVWNIFKGLKLVNSETGFKGFGHAVDATLIKNSCCRRAYLRGAFLCAGSMSDPSKGYHLEIVCEQNEQAEHIAQILSTFDIDAKIVCRKRYFVVYIKEGSAIVEFLGICDAHVSLMDFENLRILKEMSNSINRQVNCEAANIAKTIRAASRQVEDILLIQKVYGFSRLADNLREMAEVRLEYPDATLQELGKLLDPPVGKSGVNHRLRKLSELAEELR